jgi:hypothetical protein
MLRITIPKIERKQRAAVFTFNQSFDGTPSDPRHLGSGLLGDPFKFGVLRVGKCDRHAVCVPSILTHGSDSVRGYPQLFISSRVPGRLLTGKNR